MKIELYDSRRLIVRRGDSPRVYRDSTLMYRIARQLRERNLDVMRKDAGKEDGNLTFEGNYYVRDRKRRFFWHFNDAAIRPAYQDFNEGILVLTGEGPTPGGNA